MSTDKEQYLKAYQKINEEANRKKFEIFEPLKDFYIMKKSISKDFFNKGVLELSVEIAYLFSNPEPGYDGMKMFKAHLEFKGNISDGIITKLKLSRGLVNIFETMYDDVENLVAKATKIKPLHKIKDLNFALNEIVDDELLEFKNKDFFKFKSDFNEDTNPFMKVPSEELIIHKNLKDKAFSFNTYIEQNDEALKNWNKSHIDVLNKEWAKIYLDNNLDEKPNNVRKIKI